MENNLRNAYTTIDVPVENYSSFDFKDYDKYFIEHYKVTYNFINYSNKKKKAGLIVNLSDEGYATILTTQEIAEYIKNKKFISIYIGRYKTKNLLYLYTVDNAFMPIDMSKLEIENYKRLLSMDSL